jgi:hypothetical protein
MVRSYCVHRLSAQSQHATLGQASASVLCMLRRLERLRYLRQHGKAAILYDVALEMASLQRANIHFLTLINSLPVDYRLRWFLVTRKHVDVCNAASQDVSVTDLPNRANAIVGAVPTPMLSQEQIWLSFNGSGVFDAKEIEITCANERRLTLDNCFDESSLTNNWPVYEPSPKHRLEEYQRNGLRVSAMDLSVVDAQAALLVAEEHESDRFALVRGKFYRFVLTNPAGRAPVFHGFRVEAGELTPALLRALLGQ